MIKRQASNTCCLYNTYFRLRVIYRQTVNECKYIFGVNNKQKKNRDSYVNIRPKIMNKES